MGIRLARWENARNVFSHSPGCDEFFSQRSSEPGGVAHKACLCWCHNAGETLYLSEAPEYDLTPPPEYATSADRLIESEPEYVRATPVESVSAMSADSDVFTDQDAESFDAFETTAAKYPGRSREEIARNRCDTCGDSLAKCECVE